MTLVNGECFAPSLGVGRCLVGVYAYETTNGKTTLRYSPKPTLLSVCSGSYSDEAADATPPTASEIEAFYSLINKAIADGKLKGDKGDKGDTGPQGPQGVQGVSGRLKWRKICRETITEEVAQYIRDVDENGNPLSDLKAFIIRLQMPNWSTTKRTTIYLNLRKCETGEEDFWTELSFLPTRISNTTGIPVLNQINIQVEPWVHGSFTYRQSSFESNSGELFTIDQSEYADNRTPKGGVFDWTTTNFVDVIQLDTQIEDKLLPAGMIIEVWGANYED